VARTININAKRDNFTKTDIFCKIDFFHLLMITLTIKTTLTKMPQNTSHCVDVISVDVNFVDYGGRTSLMTAIEYDDIDGCLNILLNNPNLNLLDNNGNTALMLCIKRGNITIANKILSYPNVDVNVVNNLGNTALMMAIKFRNVETSIKILKYPNVDVNMVDNCGKTTLMMAIKHNDNDKIATVILDNPSVDVNVVNDSGNTALIMSVRFAKFSIAIKILNDPNVDVNVVNDSGNTALLLSIKYGIYRFTFNILNDPNIDVNVKDYKGKSALILAIQNDYSLTDGQLVSILLFDPNIDVNVKDDNGRTALMWATRLGNEVFADQILENKFVDIGITDDEGETALTWGTICGKFEIVRAILNNDKMTNDIVNKVDDEGFTPLMWAIHKGQLYANDPDQLNGAVYDDIALEIISHPYNDMNVVNRFEQTALMVALINRRYFILSIILTNSTTNVNAVDGGGRTAMMLGIILRDELGVDAIWKHSPNNINAIDHDGHTALTLSVESSNQIMMSRLAANGADLTQLVPGMRIGDYVMEELPEMFSHDGEHSKILRNNRLFSKKYLNDTDWLKRKELLCCLTHIFNWSLVNQDETERLRTWPADLSEEGKLICRAWFDVAGGYIDNGIGRLILSFY
jgi:ankyrin repeat protein